MRVEEKCETTDQIKDAVQRHLESGSNAVSVSRQVLDPEEGTLGGWLVMAWYDDSAVGIDSAIASLAR